MGKRDPIKVGDDRWDPDLGYVRAVCVTRSVVSYRQHFGLRGRYVTKAKWRSLPLEEPKEQDQGA